MVRSVRKVLLLTVLVTTTLSELHARPTSNEPWLSHYSGSISWEREAAYLDNFAIQIMNDSEMIGYILVYSGEDSCAKEAHARAMRMMRYLTHARGVPWNRVMWKDGGRFRGKGLDIFHLGVPRAELHRFGRPYEPPAKGQVIRRCSEKERREALRY